MLNEHEQRTLNNARHTRSAALFRIEALTIQYLEALAARKKVNREIRLLKDQATPADQNRRRLLEVSAEQIEAAIVRYKAELKQWKRLLNLAEADKRTVLAIKQRRQAEAQKS